MSFLGFTSSGLKPKDTPRKKNKKTEDPERLVPRASRLRVKHSTTEPPLSHAGLLYYEYIPNCFSKRLRVYTCIPSCLSKSYNIDLSKKY